LEDSSAISVYSDLFYAAKLMPCMAMVDERCWNWVGKLVDSSAWM